MHTGKVRTVIFDERFENEMVYINPIVQRADEFLETIAALVLRCDGPGQFRNFDRTVRASMGVSKEAVLKAEAKEKRARAIRRPRKSLA